LSKLIVPGPETVAVTDSTTLPVVPEAFLSATVTFATAAPTIDSNERASSAVIDPVPAPMKAVDSEGAIAFESVAAAVIVIAAGVQAISLNTPESYVFVITVNE